MLRLQESLLAASSAQLAAHSAQHMAHNLASLARLRRPSEQYAEVLVDSLLGRLQVRCCCCWGGGHGLHWLRLQAAPVCVHGTPAACLPALAGTLVLGQQQSLLRCVQRRAQSCSPATRLVSSLHLHVACMLHNLLLRGTVSPCESPLLHRLHRT